MIGDLEPAAAWDVGTRRATGRTIVQLTSRDRLQPDLLAAARDAPAGTRLTAPSG